MSAVANTERSTETRERLLLTALHLYALEGLDAVSLRRISAAAGSRNSAAVHYHFHNRNGVIEALMALIGRELGSLARAIQPASGAGRNLREACRDTLRPLVMLRSAQDWGDDAVQFLARVASSEDPDIAAMVNDIYAPFWRRLDRAVAAALPALPAPVRRLRLLFIATNVVHGMAEAAWLTRSPLGDLSHFDEGVLLDHLVDYLIGGLEAPVNAG